MKRYNFYISLLPWFICTLGALFYAYEYFLRISPSVMFADLKRVYQLSEAGLGNLSASYHYVYVPMQLVAGVLMDRYGPRRLLTIATLFCVAGSFLFAGTQYLSVAIFGRALIGFGSAFGFVGVLKLATIWLPRRYFAMFTGMATALGMLGAAFGDIALTKLVAQYGWQETIYLSAIFGIGLAFMIGLFVRDQPFDKKGHRIHIQKLDLGQVIQALINIIKMPQMWVVGLIGGLMYMPVSTFAELWGIPFLRQGLGFSAIDAANLNAMIFLGFAMGGPIAGFISDTIKRRGIPMWTGAILSSIIIFILLLVPNLSKYQVGFLLFLCGVFSSVQVIVFAVGKELNLNKYAGSAIAFINMMVMLVAGEIMQPIEGVILDLISKHSYSVGTSLPQPDYQEALIIIPIALVISALLARFAMKETYCQAKDASVVSRFADEEA